MITVEEILEYLNSDRVEDMTEEMHERSIRILEETFTLEKCIHQFRMQLPGSGRHIHW